MQPPSVAPGTSHSQRPRPRHRLESARDARQRRKRLLGYVLFVGSLVLVVNALFGENGYLETVRVQHEYSDIAAESGRVHQENQASREYLDRLENDDAAIEEAASDQLDMIYPGETLIIIKDRPDSTPKGR